MEVGEPYCTAAVGDNNELIRIAELRIESLSLSERLSGSVFARKQQLLLFLLQSSFLWAQNGRSSFNNGSSSPFNCVTFQLVGLCATSHGDLSQLVRRLKLVARDSDSIWRP